MKNVKHPLKEIDSHKVVSFGESFYMFGGFANENTLLSNIYKVSSSVDGQHSDYTVDVEEIEVRGPSPRYNHGMVRLG